MDQWVNSYFGVEMNSPIVREGARGRLAVMVSRAQPRGWGTPWLPVCPFSPLRRDESSSRKA